VLGKNDTVRGTSFEGALCVFRNAGKTAYARQAVISCAGHHSSLLLERSGVGNPDIIKVSYQPDDSRLPTRLYL
jgi:L-2-hydroxyglutarate oxidase LhgO